MKRIGIIFLTLLIVFTGTWIYKIKTPILRPDAFSDDNVAGEWWLNVKASPKLDKDWVLDAEIPVNYVPVPGQKELYMVVDDNGNVTSYRKRVKQDDGSWLWTDVSPEIPENYEPVAGLTNVYKVTQADGTIKYMKYIRNTDNSFAFVEVDKNGKLIETSKNSSVIPSNYIHVSGNVYAVYNDKGVIVGYMEKIVNKDGTFSWKETTKPKEDKSSADTPTGKKTNNNNNKDKTNNDTSIGNKNDGKGNSSIIINNGNGNVSTSQNGDGTYTETETISETKSSGGYKITYQTTVIRTYKSDGTLISTKKDGPVEVGREKEIINDNTAPDKSKIKGTLAEENSRVANSVTYNDALANEILALLNAQRKSQGLQSLSMDSNSDAYKLARTRAADMAIYNHSDYDSPLYGTLDVMLKRFNINSSSPSENMWRTTPKSANDIHSRFQAVEGSRNARMSSSYTSVGIAVVEKNGYYYIDEVYIN